MIQMSSAKTKATFIGAVYAGVTTLTVTFWGSHTDNLILLAAVLLLVFPWSFIALLASMLLIHISSANLDTQQMWLMLVGTFINAVIIYYVSRSLLRRRKS
jgi:hypothetical protein